MLLEQVDKNNILKIVRKNVNKAKKEILVTMLIAEELDNPLPLSYFTLLKKKVNEGVFLRRLGFGRKEDYNKIKEKNKLESNNCEFRYIVKEFEYQRLIIIDRKKLFFGIDGLYFASTCEPFVEVFLKYFNYNFKKGKI
ncbi:MAG: hypothetical protein M1372_01945 [Patescibacteria group bacterium]|nr:hypothetical protein [Patescibacteria group bacterium]